MSKIVPTGAGEDPVGRLGCIGTEEQGEPHEMSGGAGARLMSKVLNAFVMLHAERCQAIRQQVDSKGDAKLDAFRKEPTE